MGKQGEIGDTTRRTVTLQDVAERCGVAKITVSYALRPDTGHVSASTRARIQAIAREMGYNPAQQHAARRLRMQGTQRKVINHVVALFLAADDYDGPHFGPLFRGIQQTLLADRFALLVCNSDGVLLGTRTDLPLAFERGDVDGAIIYCTHPELARHLHEAPWFQQRPLVSLLSPSPGCATVQLDNTAGAFAVTRHLLALGHRHLLHHYPAGAYAIADERLAGMRRAYEEFALDPDVYLHFVYYSSMEDPAQGAAVLDTLRYHPEITAVVAQHDYAAVRLYHLLRSAGLRIPEDISLTGFEDTHAIAGSNGANLLTTVRAPLYEVGLQAARLIIEQITGMPDADVTITLPVECIKRSTTAPPSCHC